MQITESQLRKSIKSLLKEEVYGTIATVYHNSRQPPEEFIKVFEHESGLVGWDIGRGAGSMYGHGLYTVWKMGTGHQVDRGGYGDWIYKFKVNLHGFIIFDDAVCRQVYGASLSPLQQLQRLGKKDLINRLDDKNKQLLSDPPIENGRSARLAYKASKILAGNVNGIIFWGDNDGAVVVIYDPNIVTPIGYAKLGDAKNNVWTKWNSSEIKRSISRSAQAGAMADPKRLQKGSVEDQEKIFAFLQKANYKNKANVARLKNSDYQTKMSLIVNDKTHPDVLRILSDDNDEALRATIASRSNTPKEILIKLSNDSDEIKQEVAANPSTPTEVLLKLIDGGYKFAHVVASNEGADFDVFEKLSNNLNWNVRYDLAHNKNISYEILKKLSDDEQFQVRRVIAERPDATPEILLKLADVQQPLTVRLEVAKNQNAPIEVLEKLSNDNDTRILYKLTFHKGLTKDLLEKLLNNESSLVQKAVQQRLLSNNQNLSERNVRQLISQILALN